MYKMITIIVVSLLVVIGVTVSVCMSNYFSFKIEELPNIRKEAENQRDFIIEEEKTKQKAIDFQKEKERTEQLKLENEKLKIKAEYKEKYNSNLY